MAAFGAFGIDSVLTYAYINGNSLDATLHPAPWMVFKPNGNVGIGTINPSAKLAVNGDIKAKRVKVTSNAADWPDDVFHASYQLPGLLEMEDYINKHQHLPGVPSAAEIKKEGSVDLGSMNEILLRKVEELTLYMIELKKENTALKGRLEHLEAKQ